MSLGESRLPLDAQLLTESVVLAVIGAAASLLVARAALAAVASFVPDAALGTGTSLALELRPAVFAFAAAVSLGSALLFGLFPALHATRADLLSSIRSGAGAVAGGHRAASRFRSTLVTVQMALSMALLVSAGLLVTSLRNIAHVRLGLDAERVVTFALVPALSGYEPARTAALFGRVEQELGALPGVTAVGGATMPLLTGMTNGNAVRVEGVARSADADASVRVNAVGPGWLDALGIPLLAGRAFGDADRPGAPKVAIVNEAFARKFGLGRDVVGRRLAFGDAPGAPLDVEIVGLMRDAVYGDVKSAPPPLVVTPWRQDEGVSGLAYYVRTSGAPERTLRAIPDVVKRVDPTLAVAMLKTMPQQVRENVYLDRMVGTLSAAFALLATLLAAVGLYGVLSYTVAQRTREFGVRMALGAAPGRVRGLVLGQVGRMTLVGQALGVAAALALGGVARSLLFGLSGDDPRVVAGAAVVLAAAALAAGLVPAWRASRIPPGSALRAE
jgi:predicted permease